MPQKLCTPSDFSALTGHAMDISLDEKTSREVLAEADKNVAAAASQPKVKLVYTSLATEEAALESAKVVPCGVACPLCGFVATRMCHRKIHLRQHFTNFICRCGEVSYNRDTIGRHIRRQVIRTEPDLCEEGIRFEVDATTFAKFAKETGSPLEVFPPVRVAVTEGTENWKMIVAKSIANQRRYQGRHATAAEDESTENEEPILPTPHNKSKKSKKSKKPKKDKRPKTEPDQESTHAKRT